MMSRHIIQHSTAALIVALSLVLWQTPDAFAATTTVPGTSATIAPLDDFGATVETQLVLTWVEILGVVLVVGGALSMLRVPGLGAIGVVAGLLIIFANPIIEATFTATSAAPLSAVAPTTGTWAIPALLQPLLVFAYYPYLLLQLLLRPEFWIALACCTPLRNAMRLRV